jgi:hypothetical protein
MKESQSETFWNEEVRRCGVVDNTKKAWQEGLRRYGHVIREKGEPVRDILERRDQKMWGGRHYKEGVGKRPAMLRTLD